MADSTTLIAPSIQIEGDILKITNQDVATEYFDVYINGEYRFTIPRDIPWEYPVLIGNNLKITQAYFAQLTANNLKIE